MSTRIIEALVVALEVTNTVVSESAVKVMEADLREYPEEAVVGALTRCRRECKHRLTLADILERLPGTPTGNAEAAWAEAVAAGLTSGDEARTIVVREAVMAAFPHQLCNETGDLVASRMAFKAAYPAALAERGEKVQVVLGHDLHGREVAIREAVQQGLLTAEKARHYLPHYDDESRPLIHDDRESSGPKLIGQVLNESDPDIIRRRAEAREFALRERGREGAT